MVQPFERQLYISTTRHNSINMTRNLPAQTNSSDELLNYLRNDFGYCGCGYYEESIRTLRNVLQFAADRQASTEDSERFSAITRSVQQWVLSSPGLATWFVWLLDKHGCIWHGFNETDIWITKKGTAVLNAIVTHYLFREDDPEKPNATIGS